LTIVKVNPFQCVDYFSGILIYQNKVRISAHQLGGTAGNILVGGAMEAVAADIIVLVVLGGNGIAVSLGGHGHVESGIEHSHLRRVGHDRLAGADAHQVCGVMQGAQGDALFDGLDDLVIDDAGVGELHAAMQHTVADSIDLVHGLDHAVLRIDQDLQNSLKIELSASGDYIVNGVPQSREILKRLLKRYARLMPEAEFLLQCNPESKHYMLVALLSDLAKNNLKNVKLLK